jgi:hypothetical protein
LARFGGLRTPSETLSLPLANLDWEHGAMTVISPKTEGHGLGQFLCSPGCVRISMRLGTWPRKGKPTSFPKTSISRHRKARMVGATATCGLHSRRSSNVRD